ncbi:MAG: TetR/AcrR family transcriptional regulator [Bacillota bacterium]
MPKETFFNLPEAKKERVIDAALEEFARYPYYKASITRIVKRADIAKGSFYQYFSDKKDLFIYIIDLIMEKKMDYLESVLEKKDNLDFFVLLREIYLAGIKFARNHPRLSQIGIKLFKNPEQSILDEIMEDQRETSINFFKKLLLKGKNKGDIDEKINIELTAHILTNINNSLGEFIYKDEEINYNDMKIIDKMLYIIENGIGVD